jgi:hypothetical protein
MDTALSFDLSASNRPKYWEHLPEIGKDVFRICEPFGLPRLNGLKKIPEIQWAVIQHYHLWPTPLIDLTSSLRVAATFALGSNPPPPGSVHHGVILVVAVPAPSGSIVFDIDEHIVLTRLNSCCPPIVRRPHLQDGFLAGRFPFRGPSDDESREKSSLRFRIITKLELIDAGTFWDESHSPLPQNALLPSNDELGKAFADHFGPGGKSDLTAVAEQLSTPSSKVERGIHGAR